MMDHHLIKLINSLDRKEMTRLVAFSLSPYHNKHEDTRRLLAYLNKCYPKLTATNCDRKQIWSKLFPKQAFNNGKLAVLFTYAWRLAESFLIQEEIANSSLRSIWLANALQRRQQWKDFEYTLKKARQEHEKDELRNTNYYQRSIALAEIASESFYVLEQQALDRTLMEKEQALDQYYVLEKLRDAVEFQVRREVVQGDYSARLLEGVLEELRQNAETYATAPAIQLYFRLYQMMEQPSLASYREALSVFQNNERRFPLDEIKIIYNYLQNFCIAQINRNDPPFLRELFSLYREQLERQLLHEQGHLIEWHYKNIVTTGIRLGELDWVNTFIESQKSALSPTAAENAYRFNKASYCHVIGEYDRVLDLLTQVEYSDIRYNLGAKALLLRTYYELEEFDSLHALVESFRQYIQRNRLLADSRRNGYYHLFRLTRRIARLRAQIAYSRADQVRQSLAKIKEDIQQTQAIFNRAWLEKKIKMLSEEMVNN